MKIFNLRHLPRKQIQLKLFTDVAFFFTTSISPFHNHAQSLKVRFWRATAQSYLTYERLAATKASKVWFSYSHNCTCQRSSLPCYLPSLTVQRPARIVHFLLLCMIVKLDYCHEIFLYHDLLLPDKHPYKFTWTMLPSANLPENHI